MKKQLINEAFRLQTLAGIRPINSLNEEPKMGLKEGLEGYSYYYNSQGKPTSEDKVVVSRDEKPEKLKSITLANGKTYEIGDIEPEEGGTILLILKYNNGYEIASEIREGQLEGYSYYYNSQGKSTSEDEVVTSNEKPEKLKSITLANGKTYKIGDIEPEEGGTILHILKYNNGYEIASEIEG